MSCGFLCFTYPNREDEERRFNVVRVSSSQYTDSLSALSSGITSFLNIQNNIVVNPKHGSYNRYLFRLKTKSLLQNTNTQNSIPSRKVINNKSFQHGGIGAIAKQCGCNN